MTSIMHCVVTLMNILIPSLPQYQLGRSAVSVLVLVSADMTTLTSDTGIKPQIGCFPSVTSERIFSKASDVVTHKINMLWCCPYIHQSQVSDHGNIYDPPATQLQRPLVWSFAETLLSQGPVMMHFHVVCSM